MLAKPHSLIQRIKQSAAILGLTLVLSHIAPTHAYTSVSMYSGTGSSSTNNGANEGLGSGSVEGSYASSLGASSSSSYSGGSSSNNYGVANGYSGMTSGYSNSGSYAENTPYAADGQLNPGWEYVPASQSNIPMLNVNGQLQYGYPNVPTNSLTFVTEDGKIGWYQDEYGQGPALLPNSLEPGYPVYRGQTQPVNGFESPQVTTQNNSSGGNSYSSGSNTSSRNQVANTSPMSRNPTQRSSLALGGISAVGGFAKDTVVGALSYYSDSVNSVVDMATGGLLSSKYSGFADARARNYIRGETIIGVPSAVIGGVKNAVAAPKLALQQVTDNASSRWSNGVAQPFLSGDGYTAGYNFVYGGLALATIATPRSLVANAGKTVIVGEGAALANIAASDIVRIQNAVNRTQTPIAVVGSRASGTAHGLSDWDYVVPQGTTKSTIHSLSSSLPEGFRSIGESRNQDFFTGSVSTNLPYIQFNPVNNTTNKSFLNQIGGTTSKSVTEPVIDVKCDNCGGG